MSVRYAIIGAGAVSDYHHVPGIRIDKRSELVAVCDPNVELLEKRKSDWGVSKVTPKYEDIVDASFAKKAIEELGEWKGPVCPTAAF